MTQDWQRFAAPDERERRAHERAASVTARGLCAGLLFVLGQGLVTGAEVFRPDDWPVISAIGWALLALVIPAIVLTVRAGCRSD